MYRYNLENHFSSPIDHLKKIHSMLAPPYKTKHLPLLAWLPRLSLFRVEGSMRAFLQLSPVTPCYASSAYHQTLELSDLVQWTGFTVWLLSQSF